MRHYTCVCCSIIKATSVTSIFSSVCCNLSLMKTARADANSAIALIWHHVTWSGGQKCLCTSHIYRQMTAYLHMLLPVWPYESIRAHTSRFLFCQDETDFWRYFNISVTFVMHLCSCCCIGYKFHGRRRWRRLSLVQPEVAARLWKCYDHASSKEWGLPQLGPRTYPHWGLALYPQQLKHLLHFFRN